MVKKTHHSHLFVDISSHGFGHLSQAGPVLDALVRRAPGLRLTVRSGLSAERLRSRISAPFEHIPGRGDFGFVMVDAMRIDLEATGEAYRAFHAGWPARVEAEAAFLRRLAPDLALTDVAYLPLAGAARAGIPALAMCSLNWADLFAHFFGREGWAEPIHGQMLAAYRSAARFIRLTPAMAMPDLPNAVAVPPVASIGQVRRAELCRRIGAKNDEILALIAFGGFDADLNAAAWPVAPGVRFLAPRAWNLARHDAAAIEAAGMSFTDLLRSVDAVLTKPGYGTFTEAAYNGAAVLYLRRGDWPEQDCLIEWLAANARSRETDFGTLARNGIGAEVVKLLARREPPRPPPGGAEKAARTIAAYLP
ncbi:MAG: hypothetical protein LBS70_05740 [Candidatus Accumulibacter sp.]|nr:hypothetical protein [Accumulibacter sp.]